MQILRGTLIALSISLFSFAGCGGGDGDPGPTGGDASFSSMGTCVSTCTKSIAANCPNGVHVQADCVASCNTQQTSCNTAGKTAEFQTYLDCIESTPMTCGTTSGSPTSAQCLAQGLAVLQCSLVLPDAGSP